MVVPADPASPRHDSASIVERGDGSLLMAWMAHTGGDLIGNDHAPCDVAAMTSADGGFTWSARRLLVRNQAGDVNIHFPCLLRLPGGEILLYYQRRHALAPGARQTSTAFLCVSHDEGESFGEPWPHTVIRNSTLSADVLVPLASGRIVLPATDMSGAWGTTDHLVAGCCFSDDGGRSWQASTRWADLPLRGAMEPHIVELSSGELLMYLRTQLGAVFQSRSADAGETWSTPQTTGLRAPESMPTLARIPGTGDLLLVWNDAPYQPDFDHSGKRTPLTVAVSRDEGQTWEARKDIETDPGWEYTNPSVHFTAAGGVIITYVASRMDDPAPPGRFGRSSMPLKAVVAGIGWLYR